MKRFFLILLTCSFMLGCMNDSDDDKPENTAPANNKSSIGAELNPTTSLLSTPPTDGNLPDELRPPV